MNVFLVRVPDPNRLEEVLNTIESLGFLPFEIVEISGKLVIVVRSTASLTDDFILLEDGSFILQENNSKLIL
jgi:nitrate reductase NapAB chaperone NapD